LKFQSTASLWKEFCQMSYGLYNHYWSANILMSS
jgi:hypothetical protein